MAVWFPNWLKRAWTNNRPILAGYFVVQEYGPLTTNILSVRLGGGNLKIIRWVGMFCLILLLFAHTASPVYAQAEGLVYHVPLRGEINSSVYHSLKHAFSLAARDGAELIILEIDTFGGYVHACDEIKNLIYDTQIPVYAYVKKAISGGAYVALACDRIHMLRAAPWGCRAGGGGAGNHEKDLSVIEADADHGRTPGRIRKLPPPWCARIFPSPI